MNQEAATLIEAILRNNLKTPGATDKRAAQRVVMNMQIKLLLPGQKKAITGRLTGLSSTGASLRLSQPLSHWSVFSLYLPSREDEAIILCMVARCIGRGDGTFTIGAHFTQILRGEHSIRQQAQSPPIRIK